MVFLKKLHILLNHAENINDTDLNFELLKIHNSFNVAKQLIEYKLMDLCDLDKVEDTELDLHFFINKVLMQMRKDKRGYKDTEYFEVAHLLNFYEDLISILDKDLELVIKEYDIILSELEDPYEIENKKTE